MPRKVILDVDPGIDDAMAMCMALFDPGLRCAWRCSIRGWKCWR